MINSPLEITLPAAAALTPEFASEPLIAIILVNYNMPEAADALMDYIFEHVRCSFVPVVVDNGSDQQPPPEHTNLTLKFNRQTTGGWLAGLRMLQSHNIKPFAYWFLITSCDFPAGRVDPLTPLVELMQSDPDIAGVHPALTADSTTSHRHMVTRGGEQPRRTWQMDTIAALWRADFLDSIGWFDPRLTYAWGIDLETSYLARKRGFKLFIHEGARIRKISNIAYDMGRMGMTAEMRLQNASKEMEIVLSEKYGVVWRERLLRGTDPDDYVDPGWR